MEDDMEVVDLLDGHRYIFDTDEQDAEILIGEPHMVTLCEHGMVEAYTVEGAGGYRGIVVAGSVLPAGRYRLRFQPAGYGAGAELPHGLLTKWALHLRLNNGQPMHVIRSARAPWIREDTIADTASKEYEVHVPPGLRLRIEVATDAVGEDVTWEIVCKQNTDPAINVPERYIDDGNLTTEDGLLLDLDCPAGGGVIVMRLRNASGAQRTVWADVGVSW
jgi:hypothetical protein